jgi:hypothetical protein
MTMPTSIDVFSDAGFRWMNRSSLFLAVTDLISPELAMPSGYFVVMVSTLKGGLTHRRSGQRYPQRNRNFIMLAGGYHLPSFAPQTTLQALYRERTKGAPV